MSIRSAATICLIVAACTGCQLEQSAQSKPPTPTECRAGAFLLEGQFEGARMGQCVIENTSSVRLINQPEDAPPINHSPWYAFKVTAGKGPLRVRIDYASHVHRYDPKISFDGVHWRRLDENQVSLMSDGKSVVLDLDVNQIPLWVAAQEILDNAWYESWYDDLERHGAFSKKVIGTSLGMRPIIALESNSNAKNLVVLLGRAHPPEVTGALGMRAFVDRLVSAHPEFLQSNRILMVPQLNPDGVALGHWRHGLGHIDLNRDWGPFTQPATRSVRDILNDRLIDGFQPIVMLDFHSTQRNLVYTQSEEEERLTEGFVTEWLALAASRGVYAFEQQRRHNEGRPTAKNYFFERFQIPAVTYEVGDETPRADIERSAHVFADTLVETLRAHR